MKRTLQFETLKELAQFSQRLQCGYLINTIRLSITSNFTKDQLLIALSEYHAHEMETSDKVYSYEESMNP